MLIKIIFSLHTLLYDDDVIAKAFSSSTMMSEQRKVSHHEMADTAFMIYYDFYWLRKYLHAKLAEVPGFARENSILMYVSPLTTTHRTPDTGCHAVFYSFFTQTTRYSAHNEVYANMLNRYIRSLLRFLASLNLILDQWLLSRWFKRVLHSDSRSRNIVKNRNSLTQRTGMMWHA